MKNLTLGIVVFFLNCLPSVVFCQVDIMTKSSNEICGTNQINFSSTVEIEKTEVNGCLTSNTHPCFSPSTRDSFLVNNSTQIKYFTLLIVVVDSGLYGVTQENVDTMMHRVNDFFNPWKIEFCYDTEFIDNSLLSNYPKNADSIINVIIKDWPQLGLSGNPTKIDYSVLLNNNHQSGFALAHELGHDFKLLHTFSPNYTFPSLECSYACLDKVGYSLSLQDSVGDYISDTPPTPLNQNCAPQPGVDSCSIGFPAWSSFGYENLMGYSFCMNATFSPQQAARMHCVINLGNYEPTNVMKYESLLAYGMLHCNPNPITVIEQIDETKSLKVEVLPNPFSELATINISYPYSSNVIVEVYNYIGQQVSKSMSNMLKENQTYSLVLDGSQMNNGVYFIVVKTNTETKISQFIVSK